MLATCSTHLACLICSICDRSKEAGWFVLAPPPGRLGDGVEFRIGEGGDGLMARGTLPKGTQRK